MPWGAAKFKKDPFLVLLLLLSHFSRVRLCATPGTAAHQAPPSLGFSRKDHWGGLPFPSPMYESEKWKWSRSVATPWTAAHQDPPSMGFSRQEYWSGVPLPNTVIYPVFLSSLCCIIPPFLKEAISHAVQGLPRWTGHNSSNKMSTGGGNDEPLQYSCLKNPMNSIKRQKDTTPEEEFPKSEEVHYGTREEWRNSSIKN